MNKLMTVFSALHACCLICVAPLAQPVSDAERLLNLVGRSMTPSQVLEIANISPESVTNLRCDTYLASEVSHFYAECHALQEKGRRLMDSGQIESMVVHEIESRFTDAELKEIVRFLESPIGRKFLGQMDTAVASGVDRWLDLHQEYGRLIADFALRVREHLKPNKE